MLRSRDGGRALLLARLDQGVLAFAAVHEVGEVPKGDVGDLAQRLLGEEGLVPADEDVVEGGEAHEVVVLDDGAGVVVVEEGALVLVHVEGQTAEVPLLQRGDDGLGVDEAAARRVHEHRALLHLAQRGLVHDVPRAVRQRTVQADDVGAAQQVLQRRVLAVAGELVVGEGVEGEQLAPEPPHDAREGDADPARADDAHGPAVQRAAEEAVEGEVGLAHAVVGAVRVAVQRLHQGHGELGHGLGAVRGHVGDGEAEARRRLEVHVVVAGAAQEDGAHAQRVEGRQHVLAQRVVDEDADGGGAGREGRRLGAQREVVIRHLDLDARVGV